MTTLVCNKRGDQRFWDEVATVEVNGVLDTIANHFKKATETDKLIVDGFHYEKKYARSFYNMMWVKYLDSHPMLVQEASKYRKFTGNCADVVRTYIKESRAAVMKDEDMVELFVQMKSNQSKKAAINKAAKTTASNQPTPKTTDSSNDLPDISGVWDVKETYRPSDSIMKDKEKVFYPSGHCIPAKIVELMDTEHCLYFYKTGERNATFSKDLFIKHGFIALKSSVPHSVYAKGNTVIDVRIGMDEEMSYYDKACYGLKFTVTVK